MMNKQEVIEKIKNLNARETFMSEIIWVKRDEVLDIVKQLNEPEKPVVPQFVADWYEKNKDDFEFNIFYYLCVAYYDNPSKLSKDVYQWFADSRNEPIQTLVNMHQFGFEVEKEKVYRARHKLTGEYLSQNYAKTGYYHGLDHFHILKLSKKDWEELGVLDDKMYEVEEVEE